MKQTVFVVQETEHNIELAREYGDFHVILTYKDIEKGTEHMLAKIQRHLEGVVNWKDYILCVGDPVAIGLTLVVALGYTNGVINVLRWDKRSYKYKTDEIKL